MKLSKPTSFTARLESNMIFSSLTSDRSIAPRVGKRILITKKSHHKSSHTEWLCEKIDKNGRVPRTLSAKDLNHSESNESNVSHIAYSSHLGAGSPSCARPERCQETLLRAQAVWIGYVASTCQKRNTKRFPQYKLWHRETTFWYVDATLWHCEAFCCNYIV